MGRIKSALEIALEKTSYIEVDKDELKKNDEIKEARRIEGRYILNPEEKFEDMKRELLSLSPENVREATKLTLMANLSLVQSEGENERLERVRKVFEEFIKNREANELLSQLIPFLLQYPKHRKDLVEDIKRQAEPLLREKEEELKKKYGEEIHLRFEDDNELMEAAKHHLDELQKRYQMTLDESKKRLESLI